MGPESIGLPVAAVGPCVGVGGSYQLPCVQPTSWDVFRLCCLLGSRVAGDLSLRSALDRRGVEFSGWGFRG